MLVSNYHTYLSGTVLTRNAALRQGYYLVYSLTVVELGRNYLGCCCCESFSHCICYSATLQKQSFCGQIICNLVSCYCKVMHVVTWYLLGCWAKTSSRMRNVILNVSPMIFICSDLSYCTDT